MADNLIEIEKIPCGLYDLYLRGKIVRSFPTKNTAQIFARGLKFGIEDGDCTAEIVYR